MLANLYRPRQTLRVMLVPKEQEFAVSFRQEGLERAFRLKLSELLGFGLRPFAKSFSRSAEGQEFAVQSSLERNTLRVEIAGCSEGRYTISRGESVIVKDSFEGVFEAKLLDFDYLLYGERVAKVNDLEAEVELESGEFFGQVLFFNENGERVHPRLAYAVDDGE